MTEKPPSHPSSGNVTMRVVETATELVATAIQVVPDGALDTAMEIGGNLLHGTVEVGKTVLESAGDVLDGL